MQAHNFRTHFPALVYSTNQYRQRAASMGQVKLEFRMTIKNAAENEVACRDRGVERIAEQTPKIKRLHAFTADSLNWMQENWQTDFFYACEDGLEQGITQVTIFDVCAQIDSSNSGQLACAVQLVKCTVGIEHRQCQKTDQPSWIGRVRGASCIVPSSGELAGEIGGASRRHRSSE